MLANKNKHERDEMVKFNEEYHTYRVEGNGIYFTSVTTYIGNAFPLMSTDKMIDKMMNSAGFVEGHKYYGYTAEEIKDMWEASKLESSKLGKELHKAIEDFYNTEYDLECKQRWLKHSIIDKRNVSGWERFIDFLRRDKNYVKDPYRTEWVIYDEELGLAGTIDIVYMNGDGTLDMYDWKRTKKIPTKETAGDNISATQYWHYVLQQNFYKLIIERNYGLVVRKMHLVQLHPDYSMKVFNVPDVQDKGKSLFGLSSNQRHQVTGHT